VIISPYRKDGKKQLAHIILLLCSCRVCLPSLTQNAMNAESLNRFPSNTVMARADLSRCVAEGTGENSVTDK